MLHDSVSLLTIERFILGFSIAFLLLCSPRAGAGTVPRKPPLPDYEDVQPIFEDNCIMCHNGPKAPKGLQLNSLENVLKGSERGPVVKPGDPQGSELIRRLRGISTPRMPLSGPPWLDESEIRLFEEWIKNGAPGGSKAIVDPAPGRSYRQQKTGEPKGSVTYRDVAPIFKANCIKCHNHKGLMGPPPEGLVLSSYREIMNGTERAYVVPGNPDASELVRKIRGQSLPRMPFDGPPYLAEDQISLIEKWVEEGAQDESGQRAEAPVGRKVRLRGRLSGSWVLDGLPLGVGGGTEIKNKTSVGDYVEVRGWVTSGGGIEAEQIRARTPSSHQGEDND
ncbi:MAG TPA: c-type cytochrome domain-containing protein [Bacteroidota bacterium]|nr:c-type cytochrome domain-containing protein [Bacteroidota bacterium]